MRIGCCAPIEKYELVVESGYDYVEFPAWQVESLSGGELEILAEKIRRAGIPCIRLNSYCTGMPAIVGDACDDTKTRTYAVSLFGKASKLGVEFIGVGAPLARKLPENYDRELADRQCERFLRISAAEAETFGITLLIESVQFRLCDYLNRMDQSLAMVRRVNLPQVGLMADLYNMKTQGESWELLKEYGSLIRHMHVSTVGEGTARGLYDESDQAISDAAFAAIAACGYDDTVSIEADAPKLSFSAMKAAQEVMRRSVARAIHAAVTRNFNRRKFGCRN